MLVCFYQNVWYWEKNTSYLLEFCTVSSRQKPDAERFWRSSAVTWNSAIIAANLNWWKQRWLVCAAVCRHDHPSLDRLTFPLFLFIFIFHMYFFFAYRFSFLIWICVQWNSKVLIFNFCWSLYAHDVLN